MAMDIRAELARRTDETNAAFVRRLLPELPPQTVLGVRTPELRALARQLASDEACAPFLAALPHDCFEENQLHAFVLARIRAFDACVQEVERFLPYIDNWATCDQLSPAVFRREAPRLLPYIDRWLASDRVYTVRFAIKMLMEHFLDARFQPAYADRVAGVRSGAYYVRMMAAWYFATALAKQYETAVVFLEQQRLDVWTHNMTVRKATGSRGIPPERKAYLRTLRRKAGRDA